MVARCVLLETIEKVNNLQKMVLYDKLRSALGDLKGKTIAIWGLAFKPDTDDMREATSLVLIDQLLNDGAIVKVYDPVALPNTQALLGDAVIYCCDKYDAAQDADAVALVTEWRQFRLPDWKRVADLMRGDLIVDGRNIYNEQELKAEGLRYLRIGKR